MTNILIEREVRCPLSDALKRLGEAFPSCTGDMHDTPCELTVPFHDLGLPDLGRFARTVQVHLGKPEERFSWIAIPIAWRVAENHAFPTFHGVLEISPLSAHDVQVSVMGNYAPTFGPIGKTFDKVVGRRIAEIAVDHFLAEMASRLEATVA